MKWKILEKEYLFIKPPWLTIRKDRIKSPDGYIKDAYYVFEYPNWVNTIAITEDGKFVMVQQYRHGLGKTSFELCAGICDDTDDSELHSAQRELAEETGYTGGNWQMFMTSCANPGTHTNLVYTFLATGVVKTQDQVLDPSERISVHLLDIEEVRTMLDQNEIIQSLHASALWKYMATY